MTREDVLKIIEGKEVDVATLNKNNSYIITMEVGNMPKDTIMQMRRRVADLLHNAQIEHFVLVPTLRGLPAFKFYEFKDSEVSKETNEDDD